MTITFAGQGQIKNLDLFNSKTKQCIQFTASTRSYDDYQVVCKKKDSCEILKIRVSRERENVFIDSLKKIGFKGKLSRVNKKSEYSVSLRLVSFSFDKLGDTDSIFKFIYKVTLKNLKSNNSQTIYAKTTNTQKQKVLDGFATKTGYKFTDIVEIKGTGIIMVDLYSVIFFGSIRVFAPSRSFYF